MSDIKSRLVQIAESKGLSVRAFEEACQLKRGNISNILPGGAIGSDKLAKILDAFPDINPRWLIVGVGDMLTTETAQTAGSHEPAPTYLLNMIDKKDATIQQQAEELGKLRQQLAQARHDYDIMAAKNAAIASPPQVRAETTPAT